MGLPLSSAHILRVLHCLAAGWGLRAHSFIKNSRLQASITFVNKHEGGPLRFVAHELYSFILSHKPFGGWLLHLVCLPPRPTDRISRLWVALMRNFVDVSLGSFMEGRPSHWRGHINRDLMGWPWALPDRCLLRLEKRWWTFWNKSPRAT